MSATSKPRNKPGVALRRALGKYLPAPIFEQLKEFLVEADYNRNSLQGALDTVKGLEEVIAKYKQQQIDAAGETEAYRQQLVRIHEPIRKERDELRKSAGDAGRLKQINSGLEGKLAAMERDLRIAELRRADAERWLGLMVHVPPGAAAAAVLADSKKVADQIEGELRKRLPL